MKEILNPINNEERSNKVLDQIVLSPTQATAASMVLDPVARPHILFLNGDRGGGKSFTGLILFLMFVGRGYGLHWNGEAYRKGSLSLQGLIDESQKIVPKLFPDANFNKSLRKWTFKDGETLTYKNTETRDGAMTPTGTQKSFVMMDELTLWSDPTFMFAMLATLRSPIEGMPRFMVATSNATGAGKNWVNRQFQLPEYQNAIFNPTIIDMVTKQPKILKKVKISNLALMREENRAVKKASPDYDELMEYATQGNMALYKGWVANDWSSDEGSKFDKHVNKDVHLIEPFDVPKSWKIYRSFDYGASKPYAVLWFAVSDGTPYKWFNGKHYPNGSKKYDVVNTIAGDVFVIKELYGCEVINTAKGLNHSIDQIGEAIRNVEQVQIQRHVLPGAGDLNIFYKDPNNGGATLNKILKKYKAHFVPAPKGHNTRVPGWGLIISMLYNSTVNSSSRQPGLWICSECEHLIRTLLELQVDPKKEEDVITTGEDHLPDALRYFLTWHIKRTIVNQNENARNSFDKTAFSI